MSTAERAGMHSKPDFASLTLVRLLALPLAATFALGACVAGDEDAEDAEDDTVLDSDGKSDAFGIAENTPLATGVLRVANELTRDQLRTQVGVTSTPATYIANYRLGPDNKAGTTDDRSFRTLVELDAIPFVGAITFQRIVDYAKTHGYVPTAPPPPPQSQDPFDPASCAGPRVTSPELVGLFTPGQDYRSLGTYKLFVKHRACNAVTGCGAWGTASQALANPAYGNVTGGFPLGGAASLHAYAAGGTDKYIAIELVDQSVTNTYTKTGFALKLDGLSTIDPVTFPVAPGYRYQVLNVLYIPPSPSTDTLVGTFTATLTKNCLRVVGQDPAGTNSYALVVRF